MVDADRLATLTGVIVIFAGLVWVGPYLIATAFGWDLEGALVLGIIGFLFFLRIAGATNDGGV